MYDINIYFYVDDAFTVTIPAGETCGQLLIFSSFKVSLLLATSTFREGSSTGVSSIFNEDSDLELTNTTVRAEMKWDCEREEMKCWTENWKFVFTDPDTIVAIPTESTCLRKKSLQHRELNNVSITVVL